MENSIVLATPLVEPIYPQEFRFPKDQDNSNISRHDFPEGFIFGSGTSAFQVEGAAAEDGKGPSVWDDFCLSTPGLITDGSNGNVACDMYHRYEEDIKDMKKMGLDGYRFSISWPRILPGGRASAGVNQSAIKYYNDLIDTILKHGMKPYVTLYHWDTPLVLEKEYGGFVSKKIVEDYRAYVELCFWEFGDRVKWWTTINEPWTYAAHSYTQGGFLMPKTAPQSSAPTKNALCYRCVHNQKQDTSSTATAQTYSDSKVDTADPAKLAYIAGRNLLLCHSAAVDSYRKKFKDFQNGQIGIVLNSNWHIPYDKDSADDRAAAYRGVDFMLGWFLEPILYGKYPKTMVEYAGDNLAYFTAAEKQQLKGSIDYLGLNFYTTSYAKYDPNPDGVGYNADQKLQFISDSTLGEASGSSWLYVTPWALYDHLKYIVDKYYPQLPPMYITENGVSERNDISKTCKEGCEDSIRVRYHQDHLAYLLKAMEDFKGKLEMKGYFIWSWCDNFEWNEGYQPRFGITYVDFLNNLNRHPKNSAVWFAKFLQGPKKLLAPSKKRQLEDGSPAEKKRAREE